MGDDLTESQRNVLTAVRELTADGWPCSTREVVGRLGFRSPGSVHATLRRLGTAGRVARHARGGPGWLAVSSRFESGFVREAGDAYNPTGVRWWIFADDGDGFVFARGGRASSDQAARSEIEGARGRLEQERTAWRNRRHVEIIGGRIHRRPTHELMEDGALRPIVPADVEVGP